MKTGYDVEVTVNLQITQQEAEILQEQLDLKATIDEDSDRQQLREGMRNTLTALLRELSGVVKIEARDDREDIEDTDEPEDDEDDDMKLDE